jgi:hypothetical protein
VRVERVHELLHARAGRERGHRQHRHAAGSHGAHRLLEVAARPVGRGAQVGLGHDQHVGHLHDARLQELEHVAGLGLDHDHHGVADLLDVGLGLADPDRLDHHQVECCSQRLRRLARGGGEAPEAAARRGGADEHAVVARVVLDPGAVAEECAARALGGRVHGEHGDRAPTSAPDAHERREQRGLARAGRAGDPDQVRRGLAAERRRGHLREQARGGLAATRRAVLDQVERGRRRRAVTLSQSTTDLVGLGHWAAS